ncbi:MAG: hypothetical protein HY304_02940, partial [candidate division Zixibacteria bacterium]|nr:hypothetical protein [candidate division Zixibacteria bacterium]
MKRLICDMSNGRVSRHPIFCLCLMAALSFVAASRAEGPAGTTPAKAATPQPSQTTHRPHQPHPALHTPSAPTIPAPAAAAVVAVMPNLRDSIYATQITVTSAGIEIIDRKGRHIHLECVAPLPEMPPMPGETRSSSRDWGGLDDQSEGTGIVRIGSDINIPEDETISGDVVTIFGDIHTSGRTHGSCVTIFGNVDVDGAVDQDAVAPFGRVRVGPGGRVGHDVVASEISREPGGRIGGTREEIFIPFAGQLRGESGRLWTKSTVTALIVLKVLFWLFLVLLTHALAARNVAKVKARIQTSFFKSFMVGLISQILSLPIWLLLLVTIIGIPVALLVFPLIILAAIVVSQAAMGQLLGEKIDDNIGLSLHTPLGRTIVGVIALQSFALMTAALVWSAGASGWGGLLAFGMMALSVLVGYVVLTVGLGAVVMTRFGTRPKE